MQSIIEWLHKVARFCRNTGEALMAFGAWVETLIALLGGRGFGFGAA